MFLRKALLVSLALLVSKIVCAIFPSNKVGTYSLSGAFSFRKHSTGAALPEARAITTSIQIQPCNPDGQYAIDGTGFCVPTNGLLRFCGQLEVSVATRDCAGTNGHWCCYKPVPPAARIGKFGSNIRSVATQACTPDAHPWVQKKGLCIPTDQVDTYCANLEASASIRDCPGSENWCCYDPSPSPALFIQPCTPNLAVINDAGFCVPTEMLTTYCDDLEISASRDCRAYSGGWCCYRNKESG